MKLNQNYIPPPGFSPRLNYSDNPKGTPIENIGTYNELDFDLSNKVPVLPLKTTNKIWHLGWDIPTRYTIDNSNQCWMDNAHGHSLSPVEDKELLSICENQQDRNLIRKALGLISEEPEWMAAARYNGWTPPRE